MTLEQPASLGPFMRHLVIFGLVARWAGDHDVFGAIGAAAGERHNMIDVVNMTDFNAAVVATLFLCFVLALNIFGRVASFGIALARLIVLPVRPGKRPVFDAPSSVVIRPIFLMRDASLAHYLTIAKWVASPVGAIVGVFALFVSASPFARTLAVALLIILRPLFRALALAISALRLQSAFATPIFRKIYSCGWLHFAAFGAAFEGYIIRCAIMGLHQKFTFLLPKPRAVAPAAGHFVLGFTPVSISQGEDL